jgi:hypothetical protein
MIIGQRKSLPMAQHYVNLKSNRVSAGDGHLRRGRLEWSYETSPSPLSRVYGIRIEMQQDLSPEVFVETPDLHLLAEGRRLPHVYQRNPVRLCLYHPGTTEWRPWMRLDQTVVPWTSLWLFYFEDWLASGEWKGGGEHPPETRYDGGNVGSRAAAHPDSGERSRA